MIQSPFHLDDPDSHPARLSFGYTSSLRTIAFLISFASSVRYSKYRTSMSFFHSTLAWKPPPFFFPFPSREEEVSLPPDSTTTSAAVSPLAPLAALSRLCQTKPSSKLTKCFWQ